MMFANEEPKENVVEKIERTGEVFYRRGKREEVIKILDQIPLELEIWKNDIKIGSCKAHLDKLYSIGEKTQIRVDKKYNILIFKHTDLSKLNNIGSIDFTFILEVFDLIKCKSCKKEFQKSSLRKHLARANGCENNYSGEEIQQLIRESSKRKIGNPNF